MRYHLLIKPETKEVVRTISKSSSKNFSRLMVEGFCYLTTIDGWNLSFTNPDNFIPYTKVMTSQQYFVKIKDGE